MLAPLQRKRIIVLRLVGTVLAAALALAACGGGDVEEVASAADPAGVLKVGTSLTLLGGNVALDPLKSRGVSDFMHLHLIYDTLVRARPDGNYAPGLAESWDVVDSRTIRLRLREGLKFHDGAALDAAAVKFTIERNVAGKNRNHAPLINDVASVTAQDARTLTIRLKTPTAGAFFELLAGRETMPVSPTAAKADQEALNTQPVGAGPYRVQRFQPERVIELRKFDGHWEADAWRLAGVDFVHSPPGPPRVNALLAGQVDITELDASQAKAPEGRGNIEVRTITSDADFLYIATCKDERGEPFDDVKVRQAISYAIDRDAINRTLLSGLGEPMWSLWPKAHRFHTESLEGGYRHDPQRAKELLREAGFPNGLDVRFTFIPDNPLLARLGEVVQAQLREAGVRVDLVPTTDIVTEFYMKVQTPAAVSLWIRPGLQKVTRAFGPDSVANVCQYSDSRLDRLTDQIASLPPDDDKVEGLWDQVNEFVLQNALWTFIAWQPMVHAWNTDRIGGVNEISPTLQGPNFRTIFVKRQA